MSSDCPISRSGRTRVGKDEDVHGLSLAQLVSSLTAQVSPRRPVTAILIAYGSDADVVSLGKSAAAVHGPTGRRTRPTSARSSSLRWSTGELGCLPVTRPRPRLEDP